MKIVALKEKNCNKILAQVKKVLQSGGVAVVPTDTIYGIVGDATRPDVVKKIFAMKGRAAEKALPIFVKNVKEARKYAYISDAKAKFLEKAWPAPLETARPQGPSGAQARAGSLTGPGPVTAIFQHKEKLPKILSGGKDTIGVRIPNHPLLLELLSRLDFPLAQTSANISGMPAARDVKNVEIYFGKAKTMPDLVVDGGEVLGKPSTVVDFTGKEPVILRAGLISRAELDEVLYSVR